MATHWTWIARAKQDHLLDDTTLDTLGAYLDETVALDEAVHQLTPQSPHQTPPAINLLWAAMLSLAKEESAPHDALLELIKVLLASQAAAVGADDALANELGYTWRDLHDYLWAEHTKLRDASDLSARQWINFHAFSAGCVRDAILTDLSVVFVLTKDALETRVDASNAVLVGVDVVAASQYLVTAGRVIMQHIQSPGGTSLMQQDSGGDLWTGSADVLGRWTFWKNRFEVLHTAETLSEEAREAAWKAVVAMGKVERQSTRR
ncbi:predicted protein [Aspergillus terreus NIH2624]|uniref:Uncharacterized protein n=1 Tax=Aspergillus terreus (strain NIH 2624 / FGSC A1156) TaxID=341663 RepID=Q0CIA0_ASPTN|nr:uncharacterized protein ATEG_06584 [Aspergillus terreus NIH2624]EAU33128.1 predicted protein [Aspergillus terreus NIH2624]